MSTMNYLDLLTPHIRGKPRAEQLAAAMLKQAEDMISLLASLYGASGALSLDSAMGNQLDALGGMAGVLRPARSTADEDYRLLLRAKIAAHHWSGTNEDLPEILELAFPGRNARILDNLNGSVTFSIDGDLPPFPPEEILPVPAGIRIRS